jgi:hypothetical protein
MSVKGKVTNYSNVTPNRPTSLSGLGGDAVGGISGAGADIAGDIGGLSSALPTKSIAGNTASSLIGGGVELGGAIVGGALQASAMKEAGEEAFADSMSTLDAQEENSRIQRVQAEKARRLQKSMDSENRRQQTIGVTINKFQQEFANRLRKLQASRDNIAGHIEGKQRNQATQELVSNTLRGN